MAAPSETSRRQIVHLGLGAFHRAHQALYTELSNRQGQAQWTICGVSLFSEALSRKLACQNYSYRLLEQHPAGPNIETIRSITRALCPARDGIEAVLDELSDPATAIVSLTITEKGYGWNATTDSLDLDDALIAHDIDHPKTPKSAPGYLVEALRRRRDQGVEAFTVLSCDNLTGNGEVTRRVVTELARQQDSQLAQWIDREVRFPSTMVDRIVPAVTEATFGEIEQLAGHSEPCDLASEGYRQWVIEDDFGMGRPAWETVGAQLVTDVSGFEAAKLRLLNGSHSFLAYLGLLAGYQTIYDAISDPDYCAAVRRLMSVMAQTLDDTSVVDTADYADQLIARFKNPHVRHLTAQIAIDGSQKIPQRWVPALRFHAGNEDAIRLLALGIAAWIRCLRGRDDHQQPIELQDPMVDELRGLVRRCVDGPVFVEACLGLRSVFPQDVVTDLLVNQVQAAYQSLQFGATSTVSAYVSDEID